MVVADNRGAVNAQLGRRTGHRHLTDTLCVVTQPALSLLVCCLQRLIFQAPTPDSSPAAWAPGSAVGLSLDSILRQGSWAALPGFCDSHDQWLQLPRAKTRLSIRILCTITLARADVLLSRPRIIPPSHQTQRQLACKARRLESMTRRRYCTVQFPAFLYRSVEHTPR